MKKSVLIGSFLFFVGCAHNLELCNIHHYTSGIASDYSKRGLRVFVVSSTFDVSSQTFCRNIGMQLAHQGGYAVTSTADQSGSKADVDVRVSVTTEATGDPSNFLVSWPGFVVFAHAWLGYGYHVKYKVNCVVSNSDTGEKIAEFTEPLNLELRHSEFDRTWAAGCGWLFLYTATAFVNGFYVMSYDDDITPQLYTAAYPALAGRVAQRLVKVINAESVQPSQIGAAVASPKKSLHKYVVEHFARMSDDNFAYSFRLRLRDGADAGISAMDQIKKELRATIASDYVGAHGGKMSEVHVDLPEFTLKDSVIEGRAEIMQITVESLRYDSQTQKGVIAIKIGSSRFEDARKWVRKNIESLARDKNVALTTGQIPNASRFYLGTERVKQGNILEIEFETE
jgi:hypothetical protein